MKALIIVLTLSALMACAKPDSTQQNSIIEDQTSVAVVTVEPSRESCMRIDTERNVDFMIRMEDEFYLIQGQEVYRSDFKTITKLSTETVFLNGHCELEVIEGQLRSVILAKVSTCGGFFQPDCPPQPPPAPHVCGPQGQICY